MINKFAALLLIGMASPYQILDWYGGRHTCHTASGALGQRVRYYNKVYSCIYTTAKRQLNSGCWCQGLKPFKLQSEQRGEQCAEWERQHQEKELEVRELMSRSTARL